MTSSPSPPSMPAALVTAPESEPAPEVPKATLDLPVEARLELAADVELALVRDNVAAFSAAMPVDWVEAVSEPLVPPVREGD